MTNRNGSYYWKKTAILFLGSTIWMTAACDQASPDDSQQISKAMAPLELGGWSIAWSYVGNPSAASSIAARRINGEVEMYALNSDATLWKGNGTDAAWSYVGNPWAAIDITLTDTGLLYALNSDATGHGLYVNSAGGGDNGWRYVDAPLGAIKMNAEDRLYALNWDGAVYTHISGNSWAYMGFALPGATDMERAGDRYSYPNRWFMVKNGNLHFSSSYGVPQTWTEVPINSLWGEVLPIRDITAVGWPVEVYALTESRKLYRARFIETSCSDGIDNDDDNKTDGYDANCIETLGQGVCALYWAGSYCVSRAGTSSDALTECVSGHLISWQQPSDSSYGAQCVQSNGNDHIQFNGAPVTITCAYGRTVTGECAFSPDA